MKKIMATLVVLDSLAFAQLGNVYINIQDVYPESGNTLILKFMVDNPDAKTKVVRLNYALPAIAGASYIVDNGAIAMAKYTFGGERAGCKDSPVDNVDGLVYNFKQTSVGPGLDLQFNQPQGHQEFCLSVLRSDYAAFTHPTRHNFAYYADMPGSPLDNPVIYGYVPKFRTAYPVANTRFNASLMNGGDNPPANDKTKRLWRFSNEDGTIPSVPAKSLVDLDVASYGAYKDTRMLAASMGELVDYYGWNKSTFDGHMYNGIDDRTVNLGRCWAIGVFNLYSKFYGNRNTKPDAMTQDEMVYLAETKFEGANSQVGVFVPNASEGAVNAISAKLMKEILIGSNAVAHSYSREPLNGLKILNFLNRGTPLFISILATEKDKKGQVVNAKSGHVMLIDAMALTDDGKNDTLVHLVNLDNFGNERYIYLNSLRQFLEGYITYDKPTGFKKTDVIHPVDMDSDNDGVVDFDEAYRFGSKDSDPDSDGDGITDFDEIYSYISRIPMDATSSENWGSAAVFWNANFGNVKSSDFPQNDKNNNLLSKFTSTISEVDIPSDITLYALNRLAYNDNVACFSYYQTSVSDRIIEDGCDVASEGASVNYFSVDLGSRSFARKVYSKGNVWIRSQAKLGVAAMYNTNARVEIQDKNTVSPLVLRRGIDNWMYRVKKDLQHIDVGYTSKIVKRGESYTLKDGDKFAFLKVESGGTLNIADGEMFVGDIQVESGAKYAFKAAGFSTILHLDGSFIWRGTFDKDNSEGIAWSGCHCSADIEEFIARGFKMYQHGAGEMTVDAAWYGTIIAPKSKLVLAQPSYGKNLIGQFLADELVVHQNTNVFHVEYDPVENPAKKNISVAENNSEISISSNNAPIKIVSANNEEISFKAPVAGRYEVSFNRVDGSKAASFYVDDARANMNTVGVKKANLSKGLYFVTVKHNSYIGSKPLLIK